MRHNQGQNQKRTRGRGRVAITTDKPILTETRHLIKWSGWASAGECPQLFENTQHS